MPKGVYAGAAGDQQLLCGGFAINNAFEPSFQVGHFVDFIEHQQRCQWVSALVQDDGPVGGHVVVEVLPA